MDIPVFEIEQILINKFFRDVDYQVLINEYYDERILSDQNHKILLSLLIKYYTKFEKSPSTKIFQLLIKKYCEKNDSVSNRELLISLKNSLEQNHSDEEFLKDQVLSFLKNRLIYNAMMDNLEVIEKFKDVSQCIEKMQKINSISFDQGLGHNYFDDIDTHFEEVQNPEQRLSSGFYNFDVCTNGGFFKEGKCLAVFMAKPGLGKSTLLSNFAVNMLT